MNGADMLCDVLLANDVNVCFANPGTSEMHFVAALDRKSAMRCILGLSEGVVTGAADGYGRMADKPAATLLHLGPGLANGLANLHNARRARTPILNVVGDHASYHLQYDAPLTSDIESLARPMSHWVGRVSGATDVRRCTEEGYAAAISNRAVSTLILPADAAWGEVAPDRIAPAAIPAPPPIQKENLRAAAAALRGGKRAVLIVSGRALRAAALETAGRISAATGAQLFSQLSGRAEQGAGRVTARLIPYRVDWAVETLKDFEVAICVGGTRPVGFFAYPGKPSTMLPTGCEVIQLAHHENDLADALSQLADELGIATNAPIKSNVLRQSEIPNPTGPLTADAISLIVGRLLPDNAIVCNEAVTSIGQFHMLSPGLPPHDQISLNGGAIGIGIPLATGAAIACPDRKVVALQADGSGMYTVQGLWTQAREKLDIVTVVFSNRAYAILQDEMRNVGVNAFGRNARRMLDLDGPDLNWCSIARGFGVAAERATTIDEFRKFFEAALLHEGPFLIEAMI